MGHIPLYFKAVAGVPSLLVLDHRILWSALVLILLVTWQRRWPAIVALSRQPGKLGFLLIAAVLIAANWGVFIYAIAISKLIRPVSVTSSILSSALSWAWSLCGNTSARCSGSP